MTTRWKRKKEKRKKKLSLDQNVSEPQRLGPIDVNWLQSMEHANRLLCLSFGVLSVSESLESPLAHETRVERKIPVDLHLKRL